jgi:hypothetical protein
LENGLGGLAAILAPGDLDVVRWIAPHKRKKAHGPGLSESLVQGVDASHPYLSVVKHLLRSHV